LYGERFDACFLCLLQLEVPEQLYGPLELVGRVVGYAANDFEVEQHGSAELHGSVEGDLI
jgi:hypothetical protein